MPQQRNSFHHQRGLTLKLAARGLVRLGGSIQKFTVSPVLLIGVVLA